MRLARLLFAALLLCAPLACEEEASPGSDGGGGTGGGGGTDVCDGLDTPHQQLLNAPTDAEVVRKTPAHPPIGPGGLP